MSELLAKSESVNDKIDAAIAKTTEMVKAQPDSQKALHYSQAALNLAHAKSVLKQVEMASGESNDAVVSDEAKTRAKAAKATAS